MLYLFKMHKPRIEDCDARRSMCIRELRVLQKIHFNKLGIASKLFFSDLNSTLLIKTFLWQQTVLINFTSNMILSRCFDIHVYKISELVEVAKDLIFSIVTSYNILNEWDYELAWHEQQARRNKLLRI